MDICCEHIVPTHVRYAARKKAHRWQSRRSEAVLFELCLREYEGKLKLRLISAASTPKCHQPFQSFLVEVGLKFFHLRVWHTKHQHERAATDIDA